jgi:hypothetical protein
MDMDSFNTPVVSVGDVVEVTSPSSLLFKREILVTETKVLSGNVIMVTGVTEGLEKKVYFRTDNTEWICKHKGDGTLTEEQKLKVDRITMSGKYRKEFFTELMLLHDKFIAKDSMRESMEYTLDILLSMKGESAANYMLLLELYKLKEKHFSSYKMPSKERILDRIVKLGAGYLINDFLGNTVQPMLNEDIKRTIKNNDKEEN